MRPKDGSGFLRGNFGIDRIAVQILGVLLDELAVLLF